ncbi:MAG: 50S ribosomal protein L3 [Candidatus Dependentiae bacterium]
MTGLWGKKIGMTQVFAENKVVPVTVINTAHWFITNIRTVEKDGYDAVQVGCVRPKYEEQEFSLDWIKQPKKYFSFIREIKLNKDIALELEVGKPASFLNVIQQGDMVDVHGTSKGRGFAGVVKRHGFAGPPASHGSKMGKRPGSISFMRSQGRVPKGKRMPGHLGDDSKVIRNLEIITIKPNDNVVLLKGSVPGKAGSLIFLQKA